MNSKNVRTGRRKPRVLLVTPPLVQVNAPYPAAPWLAGFLRARGLHADQADLSIELVLRLFSRPGLLRVETALRAAPRARRTPAVRHFLRHAAACQAAVEPAVRFLQGRDEALAHAIATRRFLPEGPRFGLLRQHPALLERFGHASVQDLARHLASLFLDDLADAIHAGLDPRFGFARYAEQLAAQAPAFDELAAALAAPPNLLDRLIAQLADAAYDRFRPTLVALTVPFPGALYGALRLAQRIKARHPRVRLALGGGYVNTELRTLAEPRLFNFVDAVTLDDGELPLLRLAEWSAGAPTDRLVRTFVRRRNRVVFLDAAPGEPDPPPLAPIVPAYEDVQLDRYIAMAESAIPMHRLWSDARWIKLPAARGCPWHRCRFCDITLPYIARHAVTPPDALAAKLETLIARTGRAGFHFTDEALAPAYLDAFAARLHARGVKAAWWGNVRFEKGFTPARARRLAAAGCVAVSGGLECAYDRLLTLMTKGVTLREALRACASFARAGIRVHAYLMHGFPTQTVAETVDALEIVRQAFAAGILHSAFWHRFALTVHSPMARQPVRYGIRLLAEPTAGFAQNAIPYEEPGAAERNALEPGLRAAVFNYMHGVGLDRPLAEWFDRPIPRPRHGPHALRRLLK